MSKIKIFTVTHKDLPLIKNEIFQPIHVGKSLQTYSFPNTIGDDTGDSISYKNPNYCELTALYWIWKNYKEADIIGLSHYRRYFNFVDSNNFLNQKLLKVGKDNSKYSIENICNEKHKYKIKKCLSKYDIIMPSRNISTINKFYPISMKLDYYLFHIYEDYNNMLDVLNEEFGHEFNYKNYFKYNYKHSRYNMFISNLKIFENYCEWLFKILFKLEKRTHISQYSYQSRVFGFLAERLINLYIKENNLKVYYNNIIYIDNI